MRALVLAAVCISMSFVGCGGKILTDTSSDAGVGTGASPPSRALDDVDAGTPSANDPFHAGDDWVGTYWCEGGGANLDLRIAAMHDDEIADALFQFDLDGVTGAYHVYGSFDPSSGQTSLAPGEWIAEPDGYDNWPLVGMSGTANGDSFSGWMSSTACGTFSLTRQR